jgi:hypothetical protein
VNPQGDTQCSSLITAQDDILQFSYLLLAGVEMEGQKTWKVGPWESLVC